MKKGKQLVSKVSLKSNTALKSSGPLSPGTSTLKKSKLNPVSVKMKATLSEYIQVKRNKVKNESSECRGCGSTGASPNSHIIPRSKREDLISDPENITWHCRKCHDIWDGSDWKKKKLMNDFNSNMKYIMDEDPEYYNLLINKSENK